MREVLKEWDVAHERSLSLPRKKRNCRNSVSHSAGEQLADFVQANAHPMDGKHGISGLISHDADDAHVAQPDVSHSAGEHPSSTDSDQTALTTQQ